MPVNEILLIACFICAIVAIVLCKICICKYTKQTFSLAICIINAKQDWSGDFSDKPFADVFGKWKAELERWYAVVPSGFALPKDKSVKDGDSVVIIVSGIPAEYKDTFTKEPLSRLANERVLNEVRNTAKIAAVKRVHYDFISTVPQLQFKKP